jgi:ABC-type transport system involved in multi-copper enzyme maturation permease subunit
MRRLITVELLKIRTARLTFGLLATAAALSALATVLRAARAGAGNTAPLYTASGLTTVITLAGFGMLLAIVFGVTVSSGEFRHDTATVTYLATPDRARVLIAKAVAAACVGLMFGAVGFAVTAGIGLTFVAADGYHVALAGETIARFAAGAILGAGLLAAVGVGIGSLVRAQLGAVIGVFIWTFFLESIAGGVFNPVGPYLPFTAATTMAGAKLGGGGFGFAGTSSASPLPFAAAAALVVAVAVLLAALAARTTLRRDIA